jgi:hypothetical protein|nr:MAG TPA: hypothetical protein [Caudoviricetes sp.]
MDSEGATIVQGIASVLNLLIIIFFFVWERRSFSINLIKERKEYWYHETLLNRGIESVENCFEELDKLTKIVSELIPHNLTNTDIEPHIRNIIVEIKDQISLLKRSLNVYTKLFDKSLANKIKTIIENFEDLLLTEIEQIYLSNSQILDFSILLTNKFKILEVLYQYDVTK